MQVLMTIGQLCFYDQVKGLLLGTPYFTDNLVTHFTSSLCAGAIATTMTQPLDVLKTRAMNAKPGEFSGALDLVRYTGRNGPMAFYKVKTQFLPQIIFYLLNIFMEPDKYFLFQGYIPAFVRLGPQTILTFVFFEQLRMNFGTIPT